MYYNTFIISISELFHSNNYGNPYQYAMPDNKGKVMAFSGSSCNNIYTHDNNPIRLPTVRIITTLAI